MKEKKRQAGTGKEYREGGFREALHSLPHKMIPEAIEEICRLCYWTYGIFNLKKNGKIAFRVYEIEQVEKYFATHNINAWTGENLN